MAKTIIPYSSSIYNSWDEMTPPPGPIFEAAALGHGEDATPSDESMEGCRRDIPEDTVVVGCAPPPPANACVGKTRLENFVPEHVCMLCILITGRGDTVGSGIIQRFVLGGSLGLSKTVYYG